VPLVCSLCLEQEYFESSYPKACPEFRTESKARSGTERFDLECLGSRACWNLASNFGSPNFQKGSSSELALMPRCQQRSSKAFRKTSCCFS